MLTERFWSKVIKTETCWLWMAATSRDGYGHFWLNGKQRAHRLSYMDRFGEVPAGLVLDHLCRNRACVNPDHLEAVDVRENILRGVGLTAQNAKKTRCLHGHPFTAENTCWLADGSRECRTCRRAASARYVASKKATRP